MMKIKPFALCLLLFFAVLFLLPAGPAGAAIKKDVSRNADTDWPYWRAYTSDQSVRHLEFDGADIWASSDGGVVRWNPQSGAYTKYTSLDANADLSGGVPIAVDEDGSMWFGSCDGLLNYDGSDWLLYPKDKCFSSIAIDLDGNKWLGSWGWVYKFDGNTWTAYETPDDFHGGSILAIEVDLDGNIWVGNNNGGVYRFDGSVWEHFTSETGNIASNRIYSIYADDQGTVWVGTYSGVSKFDGSVWTQYAIDELVFENVLVIGPGSGSDMWFGTYDGVYKMAGTTITQYTTTDGMGDNAVGSIAQADTGAMWFGTYANGISEFDGIDWTIHNTLVELAPSNDINDIAAGKNGKIWFGLPSDGVSGFDGATWKHYTSSDGLVSNSTTAVVCDHLGNVWVAAQGQGLSRFDGTQWTGFTTSNGLPDDDFNAMTADSAGNLWLGTVSGLIQYDGTNWTYRNNPNASGSGVYIVTAIGVDADQNVWYATGSESNGYYGVTKYDGMTWVSYDTSDGLASNQVTSIAGGPGGVVWFGSDQGVSRFDGSSWENFGLGDGLPGLYIADIKVDVDGVVWIASRDEYGIDYFGVSKYQDGEWDTLTREDGLLHNAVNAIEIDPDGNKWFGTMYGVSELIVPLKVFLPFIRK